MATLAECPVCHKKQSIKNKLCVCGENLDNAKRCKEKVKYWINFRLPNGKQRREFIGYSIEEARDADGKRRVQKRENRIFDMKKRIIRLRTEDTKNGRPRSVPIGKALFRILKSIPRRLHNDHVFFSDKYGKPVSDIRASLKKTCEDAGILYGRFVESGFVFHDLRHTFNTNMRKAGVQGSVIMSIMGHELPGMFNRYNTVDEEDIQKAMEQLEGYIASVDQTVDQMAKNAN